MRVGVLAVVIVRRPSSSTTHRFTRTNPDGPERGQAGSLPLDRCGRDDGLALDEQVAVLMLFLEVHEICDRRLPFEPHVADGKADRSHLKRR